MLRTLNISFLILFTSNVLIGCKGNQVDPASYSLTTERIDSLFLDQYQKGNFNGSVLVIKKDTIIYESSLGYTDGSRIQLLNESYRFNMGSIYKEFPAVAIMQLVEGGHLELQDRLQKFMPELPEWSQQISVEHLLQYTGGLPKINWTKHDSISDRDVLADLNELESLLFKPGEDYLYTNNSPFLLIKIVQRISKMNFKDYAQQNLFTPLGMKNTLIKEAYPFEDRDLMAIPFDTDGEEDSFPIKISSILICSTPKDMRKWLDGLHSLKIISKESLTTLSRKSAAPQANVQGPLGHTRLTNGAITEHIHHGSSGNYEALISRYNQWGISVLLLTNQKHANLQEITQAIMQIVAD